MFCHFSFWCLMSLENVLFSFAPPSINTSTKTSAYGLSGMTTQILGVPPRLSNSRSLTASTFFEMFWWKGRESAAALRVPVEVAEGSSEATGTPARSSGGIPAEMTERRSHWPIHTWNNCALVITNTEMKETECTFNLSKIWHRTICFSCWSTVRSNK